MLVRTSQLRLSAPPVAVAVAAATIRVGPRRKPLLFARAGRIHSAVDGHPSGETGDGIDIHILLVFRSSSFSCSLRCSCGSHAAAAAAPRSATARPIRSPPRHEQKEVDELFVAQGICRASSTRRRRRRCRRAVVSINGGSSSLRPVRGHGFCGRVFISGGSSLVEVAWDVSGGGSCGAAGRCRGGRGGRSSWGGAINRCSTRWGLLAEAFS